MTTITRETSADFEHQPQCPACKARGYHELLEIWLVQTKFKLLDDVAYAYLAMCKRCGFQLPLTVDNEWVPPMPACSSYLGVCKRCGRSPDLHDDV